MNPIAARAFKASINQVPPAPPRVGKIGIILLTSLAGHLAVKLVVRVKRESLFRRDSHEFRR